MEMYKQASAEKLRVSTSKGSLSVEQLWDLNVKDLDNIAVDLQEQYENSGNKSFLVQRSVKDKTTKLKFDIVFDILATKVEESDKKSKAKEKKDHNDKILGLIMQKKEGELQGKSVAELEAMMMD